MKRDLIGISELSLDEDIIDVRSPSEYRLDHIPGSINLPVLDDDERKLIGWTYKNESSFKAKRIGASLVSKNIAKYLEGELSAKTEIGRLLFIAGEAASGADQWHWFFDRSVGKLDN